MGSYYQRNSRFPRGSFLLVVALVALFVFFQLLSSSSSPRSSSTPSSPLEASKRPRIAIITFTTDEHSYTHLSLKNKNFYAKNHGYDFIIEYETNDPLGATWHKFTMIENIINEKKHDWIWWVDFDTLVTNTTIKLEDIIQQSLLKAPKPDEIDFILTPDCFPLNNGVMLVRSRPSSVAFLRKARALGEADEHLSEQDAIRDVIDNDAQGEAAQTLMIKQITMNAFPDEIRCWEDDKPWQYGAFVIHFAGAWAYVQEDDPTGFLMRKYASQVI